MNKQFSIYLDLFRFIAAVLVFMSHVPRFSDFNLWQLGWLGHEAVILFFVLSGFVISFVVFDKKEDARSYFINRASRIYSIAFPAVLFSALLYFIGLEINPEAMSLFKDEPLQITWTFFAALTFINQSWYPTTVFSNTPYWSLGYEVLYYVLFGLAIFTRGIKRILLGGITLLIMGPSIVLYLPIWLAGVGCYFIIKRDVLTRTSSLLLLAISAVGFLFFSVESIQEAINGSVIALVSEDLSVFLLPSANMFASDYLLTFFVSLHVVCMHSIACRHQLFNLATEKVVRMFSKHTFGLYLFHMPILYFVSAVIPFESMPTAHLLTAWFITPAAAILLSVWAESRRAKYTVFFAALVDSLSIKKEETLPFLARKIHRD